MSFENIDGRNGVGPMSRYTTGWHSVEKACQAALPEKILEGNIMYSGVLYGLAVVAQPKVIVEIGTQYGASTRVWLDATKPTGGLVHSIDIDAKCADLREELKLSGVADRWTFHHGRSQDIEPMECDFLYVDGDHGYEAVCSDMARHGTKVVDGGLVVLDDYYHGWYGKIRWIDERWDVLDPIVVGPTAIVRVTPAKREIFSKVFP
jgi:hypothetical protein